MASIRVPSIACIGVIDKQNHLLHMALFPKDKRDTLEFSFALSSCLDIFDARMPHRTVEQDFGLLQAIDERLAIYGRLTNTGIKLVIVVDSDGRAVSATDFKSNTPLAVRETDLRPVFRALQSAYIDLLKNPFYTPSSANSVTINGSARPINRRASYVITSKDFIEKVRRIGETWSLIGASA